MRRRFKIRLKTFSVMAMLLGSAVIWCSHWNIEKAMAKIGIYTQKASRCQIPFVRNVSKAATSTENVIHRLTRFNSALSRFRRRAVMTHGKGPWSAEHFTEHTVDVISGDSGDLLDQMLSTYPRVGYLVLPWILNGASKTQLIWNFLNDASNLLNREYFVCTGNDDLRRFINQPESTTWTEYEKTRSPPGARSCSDNLLDANDPASLDPVYLKWTKSDEGDASSTGCFSISVAGQRYIVTQKSPLYAFVITDAFVFADGDVTNGVFKLVMNTCQPDLANTPPMQQQMMDSPVFDELFVMSQQWGFSVFHRMLENVPRIAPFLEFLVTNQRVKIHAIETDGRLPELLVILGIDPSRLVSGDARAKIVYVPPSSRCHQPLALHTQLLNEYYRSYIRNAFPFEPPHRVIMRRRTGTTRRLEPQDTVELIVRKAANDFGLTYTLFADDPVPSLNETMTMFHSAVMVVAPHGAGESNVVFSIPGIYVVEILCRPPAKISLSFKHTAHVLGHHWHGIMSLGGCPDYLDVDPFEVDSAVRQLLRLWSKKNVKISAFLY